MSWAGGEVPDMTDTPFQREYGQHLVEEVIASRMTRRELLVRASVVGLSASSVGALLAACGSSSPSPAASTASAAPKAGGTMRVVSVPPTSALDPVTFFDAGAISTAQQVAEYLIWVENDLRLRPVLAEKWAPENGGKSWVITMRQNVKFNDGSPLTTDDIVATFKRLCDPKGSSAALSNFAGILIPAGITKVDATTVRFDLERTFVDFPYLLASTNYNALVLPANYAGNFEKAPVGTGPFTLQSYTAKQGATLAKNPNYWQSGLPYLDGVQFTFNSDTSAQVLALQGGSADMMLSTSFQGGQALFTDANINVLTTKSSQFREVAMRVDTKPFTDKNVRQAIALSLDRPGLVTGLFKGKADIGNDHIFAPTFPTSPTDVPQRTQDIAKAKQLLSTAGFASGIDIKLVAEEYLEVVQYGQLIKAMLAPAGIRVNLQLQSQAQYYGSGTNQPWLQVPMGITDWAARAIPSQFFLPMLTSTGVWNSAHFKNTQFDTLALQFDATLDNTARKGIATQMATIMLDETPTIIAYWINALRATTKKVQGVEANGSEFLDLTKASLA
jgi:peptide/nickel transport system substrate-binding protein